MINIKDFAPLFTTLFIGLLLCAVLGDQTVFAATLSANIKEQSSTQRSAVKSQEIINSLNQQTSNIIHEFQQVTEQLDTLKIYNEQLQHLIISQEEQISKRTEQINSIEQTEQAIVPLMLKMIGTLEQFIDLDMPFLLQQRHQQVEDLKLMMNQADISSAEKYRLILEAFLLEMDYGRTIEAWQGTHPDDPSAIVNYFRMGRIALVYQTLDSKNTFYWSKGNKQYKTMPSEYLASVQRGFRVARKQAAPEFIKLPVSYPVQGESHAQ